MIEINARQGTDEWLRERAKHHTASEAPIMMGASKKATRAELLRMKATGDEKEYSRWVKEVLFESGHEAEAAGRPIAERIVGEELFPSTATDDDGYLLASFDGLTMMETVTWECKLWNEAKADEVVEDRCPAEDYWQVVQQLAVSGAERALYMVTDGTEERTVYCWVYPDDDDIAKLRAGWEQFDRDLAEWRPTESKPQAVAAPVDDLPAVSVQVKGELSVSDNFKVFGDALRDFIDNRLIREPQTDQDFADLDSQIKALKKAEAALDSAEQYAIAQVSPIDEMKRTKTTLHELARQNRLMAEKLLEAEKKNRRNEILQEARDALQAHIDEINAGLGKVQLPDVPCDIAGAMKGKKTLTSLRAAADQAVADAKIEASRVGQKMQAGLAVLREEAAGYEGLFRDAQQLVQKDAEDLRAVVRDRIREQKEAEEKRQQADEARRAAESAQQQRQPPAADSAPSAVSPESAAGGAPVPAEKGAQAPAQRPSDDEIVSAVAAHFAVTPDTARGWIADMQLRWAA